MNIDNDYDNDNDGNNIVPCPICDNVYCPSKEKGKCPEEDDFIRAVTMKDFIEEKIKEFWLNVDNLKQDDTLGMENCIKSIITESYNRGVEDSLKCVPEEITTMAGIGFDEDEKAHNSCRQQTIDNISKLKTNK